MLLRSLEAAFEDPTLLDLGAGVLLAAWDDRDGEGGGSAAGTIAVEIDGVPAERCRATLRLAVEGERRRTVLAFRVPGRVRGELTLDRDGTIIARTPIDDPGSRAVERLVYGLDRAARARLLGFALGACRATFRLTADPDFIGFARALAAASLGSERVEFAPRAHLTTAQTLYAAANTPPLGGIETVYLLGPHRVTQNQCTPTLVAGEAEVQLALVAPRVRDGGALTAIIIGKDGALAAGFAAAPQTPGIAALAEAGALHDGERRYVLRCLGRIAEDPEAATTARTIQLFAPEAPRELTDPKRPLSAALEFAIGCGAAGIFARGWLRDQHELVQGATLTSPFGEHAIGAIWHRLPRPDLDKRKSGADPMPGFVCRVPIEEPIPVLQHHLRLTMAGGAIELVPALKVLSDVEARDLVLGSIAPAELTETRLDEVVAPATAELHRRVMARQAPPEIVEIGAAPTNPAVSVIIPLYRNLGFLRLQVGAFAIDPEFRREVELVYVLDSPEQRPELEHLLRGLNALSGLPFRLVVMSANFGYAAANNTGVRAARGRDLLLLNSDVIPLAPGWLQTLRAQLPAAGAVGPKLLFDDGSLQHAGLTFEQDFEGRWYNTHFFKGYPRDWPEANEAREVPGVTGAAMLLPRAIFEAVGGFSEDYVIGDFEDSDLCLKIRAAGHEIFYEPRAELHHFERRSIELHAGYTRTAASSYNRRLHAARWSEAMAALMRELANDRTAAEAAPRQRQGGRR